MILSCTGCTVEYNLNITKNNIEETISVNDYQTSTRTKKDILNQYNKWYPVYVNYITAGESIEIEDFSQKVEGIEYHNKTINQISNGYKYTYRYTYPINKYYDSYILASTYNENNVHKRSNSLVLKTGKDNFLCGYDYFERAKINITIDPKVYKLNYTNAQSQKNNTYVWTLDRNNCNDSEIILTLDIIDNSLENSSNSLTSSNPSKSNISKSNQSNYYLYIFFAILIIVTYFGYKWFMNLKDKNNNID